MTDRNTLHSLKVLAKRYARASRLPHHQALDLIAAELGFSHWKAVQTAAKGGWEPTEEKLSELRAFTRQAVPELQETQTDNALPSSAFAGDQPAEEGKIGRHTYWIQVSLGDVHMYGEGWHIQIDEAPSAKPYVEITDRRVKANPVQDPEFLDKAIRIAREKAKSVHAYISTDWRRRSTMPDAEGRALHPLHATESTEWYCLHCDAKSTSLAITSNLWHCPDCGATPIDIFSAPFWLGDEAAQENLSGQRARPTSRKKMEAEVDQDHASEIEIVDTTPTLNLNEQKIELLLRMALLDDASNPGERMGALLAEVSVDADNDAFIALDIDFWPEDKEPKQAAKVAEMLGIELDLAISSGRPPFHWPGLAHHTETTVAYVEALLAAYRKYSED